MSLYRKAGGGAGTPSAAAGGESRESESESRSQNQNQGELSFPGPRRTFSRTFSARASSAGGGQGLDADQLKAMEIEEALGEVVAMLEVGREGGL